MEKIVSISKARRTLGTLAEELSDDQVRELVNSLRLLAREYLLYNGSKVNENDNNSQQPDVTA